MKNELQNRILTSIFIIPISLFFILKGKFFFIFFLIILFLISSIELFQLIKKNELKIIGLAYLIFSFYFTHNLRNSDLFFFLLILIICISSDVGGYIFGKFFKGPKLISISPNKTYSGMIGSFLLSLTNSYIFLYYSIFFNYYNSNLTNEFIFFILVLIISTFCQIGDLIISLLKRISKIKDTGKIFPGHGGLLDRIDGMILAFPLSYILFSKYI